MDIKQLFEKLVDGTFKMFYPKTSVKSVVDEEQGKDLISILQRYNHIYLDYKDSAKDTRLDVPSAFRRSGIYISYKVGRDIITEYFIGNTEEAAQDNTWIDDSNWKKIPTTDDILNSAIRIPNGSITMEMLAESLQQAFANGHVTNMVDDEDLTTKLCVIKFKDREPSSVIAQSKGYVILRKNWVNNVNVLSTGDESQATAGDTIFEVRYDFDLQGQTLNLGANSSLLFKGGTINNGKVVFNNGAILGILNTAQFGTASIEGTFVSGQVLKLSDGIKWYDGSNWVAFANSDDIANILNATATAQAGNTAAASVDKVGSTLNFNFVLPKGDKGDKGDTGETGPKGDPGQPGDVGVRTKTVFAFTATVDGTKPAKPVGGGYDFNTGQITYPVGWSATDNLSGIVWMSQKEFDSDGHNGDWSDPIRLSGQDGEPGKDGATLEFIYKVTKTDLVPPTKPDSQNKNKYVPDGWTDHPNGVSETNRCEWCCTRDKASNGVWNDWTGPNVWSNYGINGQDGDGYEYIYQKTAVGTPPSKPASVNQDEYIPDGWTDDPQGPDESNQFEWVCTRKRTNGTWGDFSNPALWAKWSADGTNGTNGKSIRFMYTKTDNSSTVPPFVKDNINPGSAWQLDMPTASGAEAIWAIQATVTYDNQLDGTWNGPWYVNPKNGADGVAPNYTCDVFIKSDTAPSKPTGNDPNNPGDGWVDYPTDNTGQWWRCTGKVNGTTNLVTEWGSVMAYNGKDGVAQDGKRTEFRFAVNDSFTTAPDCDRTQREPDGWTTAPPQKSETQVMWMITALINPDNTLSEQWTQPSVISGERGPQGKTGPIGPIGGAGPAGPSGVPGVGFECRYSLGSSTAADAATPGTTDREPEGWSLTLPTVTGNKPYIWCVQSRVTYASASDTTGSVSWSAPYRMNGTDGAGVNTGGKQIVYPAGQYDPNASYTTTDQVAPYVYDTSDGKFYVLNAKMTWKGTEQDNRTPSQDFAANKGQYWQQFNMFDAIFSKLGVFSQALVGSAVFYGDYMFSQQGKSGDNKIFGNKNLVILFKRSATTPDNPNYKLTGDNDFTSAPDGWTNGRVPDGSDPIYLTICNKIISTVNPAQVSEEDINNSKNYPSITTPIIDNNYQNFNPDNVYNGGWCPSIMFNFKTGNGHLNYGKFKFTDDTFTTDEININNATINNATINNATIGKSTINSDGQFIGTPLFNYDNSVSGNPTLPKLSPGTSATITVSGRYFSRVPSYSGATCENSEATIYYNAWTSDGLSTSASLSKKGGISFEIPIMGNIIIIYAGSCSSSGVEQWIVNVVQDIGITVSN